MKMTFNQEGFFTEKIEKYRELCLDKGGKEVKLSTVTTPYIKESAKENSARKPEKEGEEAVMCKWCRHAFIVAESDEVPFTEGRVIHCNWCDRPIRKTELMEVQTLAGQTSRAKKQKDKRNPPSLANKDNNDSSLPLAILTLILFAYNRPLATYIQVISPFFRGEDRRFYILA